MNGKLLLFDIDGVLIKEAVFINRFSVAIKKVFNLDADINKVTTSGKTDTGILFELSKSVCINSKEVRKHLKELYDAEINYVKENISNVEISPNKGVLNLLIELKNRRYVLGLVTGNLKQIAKMKLKKAKLFNFFDAGGFGELSRIRSELIKEAIREANLKLKMRIDKNNIFYFGDSTLDIYAGRMAGIKTIAVATGNCSIKQLKQSKPNFVLEALSNLNKVLNIIR